MFCTIFGKEVELRLYITRYNEIYNSTRITYFWTHQTTHNTGYLVVVKPDSSAMTLWALTLTPRLISNCTCYKVENGISYPFLTSTMQLLQVVMKWFYTTIYWAFDNLSVLEIKLIKVSKMKNPTASLEYYPKATAHSHPQFSHIHQV